MSANTVLPHGGGELSSFDPQDNGCIEDTTSGTFDSLVSRCSIGMSVGSAGMKSPTWAAAPDFWEQGVFFPGSGGSGNQILFYNGATVVAQVVSSGPLTWTLQTLQGGVMTTVGSFTLVSATLNHFGFRIAAGASGIAEGYLANTNIFRVTGLDHSDFSGITQVQYLGAIGGFTTRWSQIIHDTISHIGDSLVTIAENAVSAVNDDWFGAVGNINEIVLSDATSVTSDAANQVGTYYQTGASLGTYNVRAVMIGARAQKTSGSSANLQVALRTNGTNYFSPTIALDFGFQACCASWTVNPFTGTTWDPASAATIEAGMKSIA
jgi:hypothetical protein